MKDRERWIEIRTIIMEASINSKARTMEIIRIDPIVEYLDEEDREDRIRIVEETEIRTMNMIKDNPISTLNSGWRIEVTMNDRKRNSRGRKRNRIIAADLGN